ncbi:hypothetical protein HY947_00040 [Candidatus Gottesmanbacteria bacterium]|nr:hypothetical protein [Candidatus Gottesmanbacteria bacterium]
MKKSGTNANQNSDIKNMVKDAILELDLPTKKDILDLDLPTKKDMRDFSSRTDIKSLSDKIDRNQKSLDSLDDISKKIDRNQKSLDQIDNLTRILNENEQNLKDLGGLKERLDLLDKIYVKIDKIAGDVMTYRNQQELNSAEISKHNDRIETLEKHAGIAASL